MPKVDGFILLTEFEQSECSYALDETRQPVFDEEITTVRAHGKMGVELLMNRPLLGDPIVPSDMYAKTGLFPIAFEDLSREGGCVLNQLVLCLTGRKDTRKRCRIHGQTVAIEDDDGSDGFMAKYSVQELGDMVEAYFDRR